MVTRFVQLLFLKRMVSPNGHSGFLFSEDEPTALVQHAGGPCAVIAPMQAFILRYIITGNQTKSVRGDVVLQMIMIFVSFSD